MFLRHDSVTNCLWIALLFEKNEKVSDMLKMLLGFIKEEGPRDLKLTVVKNGYN